MKKNDGMIKQALTEAQYQLAFSRAEVQRWDEIVKSLSTAWELSCGGPEAERILDVKLSKRFRLPEGETTVRVLPNKKRRKKPARRKYVARKSKKDDNGNKKTAPLWTQCFHKVLKSGGSYSRRELADAGLKIRGIGTYTQAYAALVWAIKAGHLEEDSGVVTLAPEPKSKAS